MDEYLENYKKRYPLGRTGECEDTTAAIEYLIGESASFLTGHLFPIDGGMIQRFFFVDFASKFSFDSFFYSFEFQLSALLVVDFEFKNF